MKMGWLSAKAEMKRKEKIKWHSRHFAKKYIDYRED